MYKCVHTRVVEGAYNINHMRIFTGTNSKCLLTAVCLVAVPMLIASLSGTA